MATIKLENGLRKLKVAQIEESGDYGAIITVADLTQITAETSEGETKLPAGNYVIYSKKTKGQTNGSLGFYAMEDDSEKTLFGTKENADGNILYGMKDEKRLVALIIEFTAVNPATNAEEDGFIIFPKVSLGEISDDLATKDADGNETINAKSLSFSAMALDNSNKTYKLKGFGNTPKQITQAMFEPRQKG